MTQSTVSELLARRVAQLEQDRDRWQSMAMDAQRSARLRGICVCWLIGNATESHLRYLALDEESMDIVSHNCTDDVFRELRQRGLSPQETED